MGTLRSVELEFQPRVEFSIDDSRFGCIANPPLLMVCVIRWRIVSGLGGDSSTFLNLPMRAYEPAA
jgi:hypothetical protein